MEGVKRSMLSRRALLGGALVAGAAAAMPGAFLRPALAQAQAQAGATGADDVAAYAATEGVTFDGRQLRTDIARRPVERFSRA